MLKSKLILKLEEVLRYVYSSEKRSLCLMKLSSQTLPNLPDGIFCLLFFPNECLILCKYMTKFEAFHQSYFIKHKPLISDEFLNKRF